MDGFWSIPRKKPKIEEDITTEKITKEASDLDNASQASQASQEEK